MLFQRLLKKYPFMVYPREHQSNAHIINNKLISKFK